MMRLPIVSLVMVAATAALAADSHPLPVAQCRMLAEAFAKAIGREPALATADTSLAKLPFSDHLPRGQACLFTAKATGRRAGARAAQALGEFVLRLHDQGWDGDAELTSDGGDDPQTGLRKDAARLAFFIEDHPAPACRDLGPEERCKAPDGAHSWVFRGVAFEGLSPTIGPPGKPEHASP